MQTVELIPAHLWICPECGRDNFIRCIIAEFSPEEEEEIREKIGIDIKDKGSFLTAPDKVICQFCHCKFETKYFQEFDEYTDE